MPVPTLDKSWQFNVNQILRTTGVYATDNRIFLRALKDSLKGFASNGWTVVGSSNSLVAALDGVDRWVDNASLVWAAAGVAHSWIVLKQAQVAANYSICIDLSVVAVYDRANIFVSMTAGFAGGTTLNRPTAVDEIQLQGVNSFHTLNPGAAFDAILHCFQSTDGQVTRVFAFNTTGTCGMYLDFSKPKNPVTGWGTPAVACWSRLAPTFANLNDVAGYYLYAVAGRVLYLTSEGYVASMVGETRPSLNDINTSDVCWSSIGLSCEVVGYRGRHGELYDVWWGSTYRAYGDTAPADLTRTFVQFGNLIVPWTGDVPRTFL